MVFFSKVQASCLRVGSPKPYCYDSMKFSAGQQFCFHALCSRDLVLSHDRAEPRSRDTELHFVSAYRHSYQGHMLALQDCEPHICLKAGQMLCIKLSSCFSVRLGSGPSIVSHIHSNLPVAGAALCRLISTGITMMQRSIHYSQCKLLCPIAFVPGW